MYISIKILDKFTCDVINRVLLKEHRHELVNAKGTGCIEPFHIRPHEKLSLGSPTNEIMIPIEI